MPELPEVETIRTSLLSVLRNKIISSVEVFTPEVWLGDALPPTGWQIETIDRRGKYLLFRLNRNVGSTPAANLTTHPRQALLIVHLRMTGQLLLQTSDQPAVRHDHIRMRLDPAPGSEKPEAPQSGPIWLVYHDTRRFGRCWLLSADPECPSGHMPPGLLKLGPEPLAPMLDARILARQLAKRPNSSLKAAMLDQTVIAGLGNIYADETLFAAGLQPARTVRSISGAETERLAAAVVDVLQRAIACQGTTLRDYVNGWNRKGSFQDCLMVYGRSGEPCRRCGSTISQCRLAGRSTCWCPSCQPANAVGGEA